MRIQDLLFSKRQIGESDSGEEGKKKDSRGGGIVVLHFSCCMNLLTECSLTFPQ